MDLLRSSNSLFTRHTSAFLLSFSRSASKKRSSSKAWLKRHVSDQYVKKAFVEKHVRSRSFFKLSEIIQKHRLIRPSDVVLDLGASPGGWSVAASKILDSSRGGRLICVDLLQFDKIKTKNELRIDYITGDFSSNEVQRELLQLLATNNKTTNDSGEREDQRLLIPQKATVILSDMLENSTGLKDTDHYRSMNLVHDVLDFSIVNLMPKRGCMFVKYLRGADDKEMISYAKELFEEVKIVKPDASRKESNEAYILCRGRL